MQLLAVVSFAFTLLQVARSQAQSPVWGEVPFLFSRKFIVLMPGVQANAVVLDGLVLLVSIFLVQCLKLC